MSMVIGDPSLHRNSYRPEASESRYSNYNQPLTVESYYANQPYPCPSARAQQYPITSYYNGVDVTNLPTLAETPSESGELIPVFPQGEFYEPGRYYTENGVLSAPLEKNEVYRYYSPDSGDQTLAYYSAEEEDFKHPISPFEVPYYHQKANSTMGNGSSFISDANRSKATQKTKKNRRESTSSSDNGGFESGTPKLALGVKEKLRSSFDKISLKTPFRWSSSDKLTHGGKSKNKNNRRYSDSSTVFLAVNPGDDKKTSKVGSSSTELEKKNSRMQGESRMVRAYSSRSGSANHDADCHIKANRRDYVNLTSVHSKVVHTQSAQPVDGLFENNNTGRVMNDYYVMHNSTSSTMPRHQSIENKDAISRAKGTWKMLKGVKTKHAPIKAPFIPHHTLLEGSTDSLQSSTTLQDTLTTRTPTPPVVEEVETNEPPKLTPVSGKLLLDKNNTVAIVRPTAFKLIAPVTSNHNSPFSHKDTWQVLDEQNSITAEGCGAGLNSASESNNSDSGRHSTTSIPVGGANEDTFSCSASEGYDSARVSSSTTHSATQEQDFVPSEPTVKDSTDDVMIRNLESRVKEKQGEIQLLRRSLEDNEKTLHMVYEDQHRSRECDMMELKQKYSNQLKTQARKSLQTQHRLERQYHRMQDELTRLLQINKELEERIKSMTEAIDAQSRQHDDIAELKARLEESEMEMQQKHGEISLLKRQLREKQLEVTQRANDVIGLRTQNRDLCAQMSLRDSEAMEMNARLNERNLEIAELERQLSLASSRGNWSAAGSVTSPVFRNGHYADPPSYSDIERRSRDTSVCSDASRDDRNYLPPPSPLQQNSSGSPKGLTSYHEDLFKRLQAAESRCVEQEKRFEVERRQWAEEKGKVMKYQKQLQGNYVHMYKRSHVLEREVGILTSRLEALGVSAVIGSRRSEGSSEEHRDLCYPMEI